MCQCCGVRRSAIAGMRCDCSDSTTEQGLCTDTVAPDGCRWLCWEGCVGEACVPDGPAWGTARAQVGTGPATTATKLCKADALA